jgi:RNA polymerase sigma factor for flagellar operon FliA
MDAGKDEHGAIDRLATLTTTLAVGLMLEEWRDEEIGQIGAIEPTAYEALEWKQTELALRAGVESLPANEAFIVRQHYLGGVSFRQIAAILDLSAGRVSQLHARALARLRQQMAKMG